MKIADHSVAAFLTSDYPPIPDSEQQDWKELGKLLAIESPDAFFQALRDRTPAQQYNAQIALRQAGYSVYAVGNGSEIVYEVQLDGRRWSIHAAAQSDVSLQPLRYSSDPDARVRTQSGASLKQFRTVERRASRP